MDAEMRIHVEVRMNHVWHHFAQPDIKPDYRLYAIAAGEGLEYLRDGDLIKPVAHIYELPDDMSPVTRLCHDTDKASGLVYLTGVLTAGDLPILQEALYADAPWKPKSPYGELNLEHGILHTHINNGTLAEHKGFDDLRLVFWFRKAV